MSEYITGFCSVGGHEGAVKLSPSGVQLRNCLGSYSVPTSGTFGRQIQVDCACDCHKAFAQIREMMAAMQAMHGNEQSAPPVSVQESATPTRAPVPTVRPAASTTAPATGAPSGGLLPFQRATIDQNLRERTPTGRTKRGNLEESVRLVLVQYKIFVPSGTVTPGFIARAVDKENPPSQGAVSAVLDRWEKRNLIKIGRKPLRVEQITNLGERILLKIGT